MVKEDLVDALVARFETVGVRASKEISWKLFKAGFDAVMDVLLDNSDEALSLAGVGRFEIQKSEPRKSKVGLVDFVPRFKYKPSVAFSQRMEEALGQVPDPEKLEAAKARLRAEGDVPGFLKGKVTEVDNSEGTGHPPVQPDIKPGEEAAVNRTEEPEVVDFDFDFGDF